MTVVDFLLERGKNHPNQVAIHQPYRRLTGYRYWTVTYDILADRVKSAAAGLQMLGLKPGDRVVLLAKPSIDFFTAVFAIMHAGCVLVAIDPGIGRKNMGRCLAEADPQAILGIPAAHAARFLLRWAPQARLKLVCDGRWPGAIGTKRLLDLGKSRPLQKSPVTDDAPAAILFTSGSTGPAKGVCYDHRHFLAQIDALQQTFQFAEGEIDCATFPLFALFAPALGMTAVIPDMDFTRPGKVNAKKLKQIIDDHGATNLFGSPALLARLAAAHEKDQAYRLSSLTRVISAGAPVPPRTMRRLAPVIGAETPIYTPYGATECLPVAVTDSQHILGNNEEKTAAGAGVYVGPPVDQLNVRIIPITDETHLSLPDALPTGTIGEICVQAAQTTLAYWQRDQATDRAKCHDDQQRIWHRMGDVGYLDDHGDLWFCGRVAHRVTLTSGPLYSVCIEGMINNVPGVFRSALIALPDNNATAGICFEGDPATNPTTVAQAIGDFIQRHSLPLSSVYHRPSFPVDIRHNAKINRPLLAQWATNQRPVWQAS